MVVLDTSVRVPRRAAQVAVLYPIESVWARFTPSPHWVEDASRDCKRIEETLRPVIGTVLAWKGHDANRPTPEQLQVAERALLAIRPHLRKIDTGPTVEEIFVLVRRLQGTLSGEHGIGLTKADAMFA